MFAVLSLSDLQTKAKTQSYEWTRQMFNVPQIQNINILLLLASYTTHHLIIPKLQFVSFYFAPPHLSLQLTTLVMSNSHIHILLLLNPTSS